MQTSNKNWWLCNSLSTSETMLKCDSLVGSLIKQPSAFVHEISACKSVFSNLLFFQISRQIVGGFGVGQCSGFGWSRVNVLHSSYYGAKFWICAENSVDNTGMFSLPLSSAHTEPRPFLLLPPPHQRGGRGGTRSRGGHSRDS